MAIFAKKQEWDHKVSAEVGGTPAAAPASTAAGSARGYGIAEAIQLMRGLPVDQHPDLVVRVVRATLASLNVRLPDIIEDASRKQKTTEERIAAVHGQIGELEKQLEAHRRDIAALEADLKETTGVKERLQMAEKSAGTAPATTMMGTGVSSMSPAVAAALASSATTSGQAPPPGLSKPAS